MPRPSAEEYDTPGQFRRRSGGQSPGKIGQIAVESSEFSIQYPGGGKQRFQNGRNLAEVFVR